MNQNLHLNQKLTKFLRVCQFVIRLLEWLMKNNKFMIEYIIINKLFSRLQQNKNKAIYY